MNLFGIISCFILLNAPVFSQDNMNSISLNLLNVENQSLTDVMEKCILEEKACPYYNSELIFNINFANSKKCSLSIESLVDSNLVLMLSPTGYILYKNHLFIVTGKLCDDLFSKTKFVKAFNYTDYSKTNDGEINVFTDDSFSTWFYEVIDDRVLFKHKSSSCN